MLLNCDFSENMGACPFLLNVHNIVKITKNKKKQEDAQEFLENAEIEKVVQRYSEFIQYPILLYSSKIETIEEEIESETDANAEKDSDELDVSDEENADKPKTKTIEKTVWFWKRVKLLLLFFCIFYFLFFLEISFFLRVFAIVMFCFFFCFPRKQHENGTQKKQKKQHFKLLVFVLFFYCKHEYIHISQADTKIKTAQKVSKNYKKNTKAKQNTNNEKKHS